MLDATIILEVPKPEGVTFMPAPFVRIETAPPLRLSVALLFMTPIPLTNVRDCPEVGVIAIVPPLVEIVAELTLVDICMALATPPSLMLIAEAPVATMLPPTKNSPGACIVSEPPPVTVT